MITHASKNAIYLHIFPDLQTFCVNLGAPVARALKGELIFNMEYSPQQFGCWWERQASARLVIIDGVICRVEFIAVVCGRSLTRLFFGLD